MCASSEVVRVKRSPTLTFESVGLATSIAMRESRHQHQLRLHLLPPLVMTDIDFTGTVDIATGGKLLIQRVKRVRTACCSITRIWRHNSLRVRLSIFYFLVPRNERLVVDRRTQAALVVLCVLLGLGGDITAGSTKPAAYSTGVAKDVDTDLGIRKLC